MFHKEEFTLEFFSSQWISGNKALTPQNSLERDTDCTVCSIKKNGYVNSFSNSNDDSNIFFIVNRCVVIATILNMYQRLYFTCWSMKKPVRNYSLFLFPLFWICICLIFSLPFYFPHWIRSLDWLSTYLSVFLFFSF